MTSVRVKLFARARDVAGTEEFELEIWEGALVADVRRLLAIQYPKLAEILLKSAVAVNEEYAGETAPVAPGDEVAIIPPVSGGCRG